MDLFHQVSKSCTILTLLLHVAKETPSKLERFLCLKDSKRTGPFQFSPENNLIKELVVLVQAVPTAVWPYCSFSIVCCSKGHLLIFLPRTDLFRIQGKGATDMFYFEREIWKSTWESEWRKTASHLLYFSWFIALPGSFFSCSRMSLE